MSLNHYSSNLPEPHGWSESSEKTSASNAGLWASHRQLYNQYNLGAGSGAGAMFCGGSTGFSFNLNNEDEEELLEEQMAADEGEINRELEGEEREIPKEPLFEKPLTPSDVGKLNRLVIPKQHAEKNFPLNGGDSSEKGLLLAFEDEMGKSWRFRYSYWNSSQSYVLTKGWSRFVKEKRLDAGDVVLFSRHSEDVGRLFIGWRRRNSGREQESGVARPTPGGGGGGWGRLFFPGGYPYPSQHQTSSSLPYQPNYSHAGSVIQNQTTAAAAVSGNSKRRLRLFGVNLEWQAADESEPSTPEGSPMSSQGQAHQHPYHQYCSGHQTHTDG